jgi:hypothetical protein
VCVEAIGRQMVPPPGIEPGPTAPEAVALSITQRGHECLLRRTGTFRRPGRLWYDIGRFLVNYFEPSFDEIVHFKIDKEVEKPKLLPLPERKMG